MHAIGASRTGCVCMHSVQHRNFIGARPAFSCAKRAVNQRKSTVVVRADTDYYNLLGVSKNADKKDIKSAYRQKARKFHPDVNKEPGAEETFKKIGEAYEVLSDDNKRAIYDRYGEAGLKGSSFGGGGGQGDFTNPFDMFEQIFTGGMSGFGGMGGMGGRRADRNAPIQGEDLQTRLQIDFMDAVHGTSAELENSRLVSCGTCQGNGMKPGTTAVTCGACNGQGQVVQTVRTPLGMMQQIIPCRTCSGTGRITTACTTCAGDGRVRESKRVELKVPPGVDNGSRLRIRGEGNAGKRAGPPGDLYVVIAVKEHPELVRQENNINSTIEVSYVDAILGKTVNVNTVDGPVDLKVPPGTQPGTTLLMTKRGVPFLNAPSRRGDHEVFVRVKIPKQISQEEREIIEKLRNMGKRHA